MDESIIANSEDLPKIDATSLRDEKGRWLKGVSGNPKGGKPNRYKVRDFAVHILGDTFDIASRMLKGEGEFYDIKPADRLKLIMELWNRVDGKVATQIVLKKEEDDIKEMDAAQINDELLQIDEQLKQLGVTDDEE